MSYISMPTELLKGTLDLLILRALSIRACHGLEIARRIEEVTGGMFEVKPGSLFPALHRLEERGWLSAEWGESEAHRRARYYRLTRTGRRQLETATVRWKRIAEAMAKAIEATS
jgi:PadR family transcriptional regulator PadR